MLFAGLALVFGLIIGSFLNVVIWRYGTGWSLGGRSKCLSCGQTLRWFELVPVFSWLAQAGRCRRCGAKISLQYPIVELVTGLVFFGLALISGTIWVFLWLALAMSFLIALTAYDLKHQIIPDGLVLGFVLASLGARLVAVWPQGPFSFFWLAVLAGVVWFLIFAAGWFLSSGRWLGFGDAKLVAGIGFLLGLDRSLTAIFIAFWSGAVIGLALILISRLAKPGGVLAGRYQFTMKSELPFAPFLALGTVVALIFTFHGWWLF